jgi:hypothetical protein
MIGVNEVPQDQALSHLATALDTVAMQGVFQASLFDGGRFRVRDCQIERVKYKPGQNCLVCYRLEIFDSFTNTVGEQLLCARVYQAGSAPAHFQKANTPALVAPKFGPPLSCLPHLDMVAWAFPNDRKLNGLPVLMDETYLRQAGLPPLIQAHWGREWEIAGLALSLVHYAPEYTCAARVQLQLRQKQTGGAQAVTLYGKTYYGQEGVETYRLMRELWDGDARRQGRLRIARPLGYDPRFKLLWQLGLPGQTLLEKEADPAHFRSLLDQVAETVAALHLSPTTRARNHTTNDSLIKLQEMRRLLTQVRPSCAEAARTVIDRLLRQAERLEAQPAATLHGDLHLKNFLVDGDEVALIDLDSLCHGSPWQEMGSLAAGILYRGLQSGAQADELVDAIYCRYAQLVPWPASPFLRNWHTAAALINERAFRSITRLKNERLDIVDDVIRLADRISGLEIGTRINADERR